MRRPSAGVGLFIGAGLLLTNPQSAWSQLAESPLPGTSQDRPVSTRPGAEAPPPGTTRPGIRPASDIGIYTTLCQTIPEVTYKQTPLADVIRDFRRRLDVNLHVQVETLAQFGVQMSRPVTLTLKRLPAARVLELALEDAGGQDVRLGYEVQDGVLVISTQEALSKELVVRTYLARDLIEGAGAGGQAVSPELREDRLQQLIAVIGGTVEPDSWVENGGSASITPLDGTLVVRNWPAAQEQVKALLETLRSLPAGESAWVPPIPPNVDEANRTIHSALQRVWPNASYDGAPLHVVIEDLRRRLNVNVHAFMRDLDAHGVPADRPVRLELKDVTAERVLRQVLADAGVDVRLSFEVDRGVLIIASDEHLQRSNTIRVYDVSDVAPDSHPRERLVQALYNSIVPDSWMVNGGRGGIEYFGARMIVHQSPGVHRRIEALLAQLRQHQRGVKEPARP